VRNAFFLYNKLRQAANNFKADGDIICRASYISALTNFLV